ncbi:hypothetical protein [Flavobacterium sp. KACC 22763]|uniref:hypothetical protein n=1 Tax=Flavobacterium sp. KACC 22763 TaxID=3025668 RepID=UPI002366088A|nr:hypothetical protein [Flavobacterium sp. KACC 22763]WDF63200.1 hypothetical protein PQ463_16460 [Flavobacterium sp. KACC 22763]
MKELVIESEGIRIKEYFIPPFELREGELLVLYLYEGAHFQGIKTELVNIFTGKIKNENVTVIKPLTYVDYFRESKFRSLFFPLRVGEYLKKKANLESKFIQKIYEIPWINKKTKINELHWNSKRLLSLYATFSKTKHIVFELAGQGPVDAKETYDIVRNEIRNGGSAILIDWVADMKNDCDKFITLEWLSV